MMHNCFMDRIYSFHKERSVKVANNLNSYPYLQMIINLPIQTLLLVPRFKTQMIQCLCTKIALVVFKVHRKENYPHQINKILEINSDCVAT